MSRNQYLIDLNYDYDCDLLKSQSISAMNYSSEYIDPRYSNRKIKNWRISKISNQYIEKIMSDFEITGSPRFYWLEPNSIVPPHIDNDTTCSINFILSENPAPVYFGNTPYYYSQCLLNTTKLHWVRNGPIRRLLFKISIFKETYEQLSKRIKYKLNI